MIPCLRPLTAAYREHQTLIQASTLQGFAAVVGYCINILCLRTIGPTIFGEIVLFTSIGGIYAIILNFGDEYLFINRTITRRSYSCIALQRVLLIAAPTLLIAFIASPLAAVSFGIFASHGVISRHFIEARNAQVAEVVTIFLLRLPLVGAVLLVEQSLVAAAIFFASASIPIVPRVSAFLSHRTVAPPEEPSNGQVRYLLSASAMAAPVLTGLAPRVLLGFVFGSKVLADVYVAHQLTQPFLIVINSIVSIYRRRFGLGIQSRFAFAVVAVAVALGLLQAAIFPVLHALGLEEQIFGFRPSPYVWFLGAGLIVYPIAHAFAMFRDRFYIVVVNTIVGGVGAAAITFLAGSLEQSFAILIALPFAAAVALLAGGVLLKDGDNK